MAARRTIPFRFGDKHKGYIKACADNTFNFAEGAVRAGKTVDNVFAFAHELKTTPDKIHLASGSTIANTLLNTGRVFFMPECKLVINGLQAAVWDPKAAEKGKDERLDNFSTDIDILDAFEYSWERFIPKLTPEVR